MAKAPDPKQVAAMIAAEEAAKQAAEVRAARGRMVMWLFIDGERRVLRLLDTTAGMGPTNVNDMFLSEDRLPAPAIATISNRTVAVSNTLAFAVDVTKDPADVGRFKTPSLRNVARTAPYMHNGLFDLDGLLNMYSGGMPTLKRKPEQANDPLFPTKSPHLRPLNLDARKKADVKAFLESLTERRRRVKPPEMPVLGDAGSDSPPPAEPR